MIEFVLNAVGTTDTGVRIRHPNLVYILNDDTDVMLGSAATLRQTRALVAGAGAEFTQFRTLSPKCTPSRTGQLVGRHYHNVRPKVHALFTVEAGGSEASMAPPGGGLNESTMFEETALFPQLVAAGYWTSIVGKVHNGQSSWLCTPGHNRTEVFTHVGTLCHPCGNYWGDEYVTKDVGETTTKLQKINGTDWSAYSHAQFGNRSIAFMRQAVAFRRPFFAYIGTTGPHLPSIPAPWHLPLVASWADMIAPRTPNFNGHFSSHHPRIAALPKIDGDKVHVVDENMRNRLGTLLSIDDLVADIVSVLDELKVLDRTYLLFSSDHGYHLGQWRLPMEKMWPYETDCRIPFFIRGPGIAAGTRIDAMGINMDIAPTLLDLAGIKVPSNYDGRSLLPMLIGTKADTSAARRGWRTRTVISFAEGAYQYWGRVTLAPWPANLSMPGSVREPPYKSADGKVYTFDAPDNQWRMLRVANASHNVSFVQWDPEFQFKSVAFSALWDLNADPYQQGNLWPGLGEGERSAWLAELECEWACAGHYGRQGDCS